MGALGNFFKNISMKFFNFKIILYQFGGVKLISTAEILSIKDLLILTREKGKRLRRTVFNSVPPAMFGFLVHLFLINLKKNRVFLQSCVI